MGIATEVATKQVKGAGTVWQVKTTGSDEFRTVPGVETIPTIGGAAEYDDTTRIDADEREFTEKLQTPQEFEIVFDDLPADLVQRALLTDVDARETIDSQVVYANGRIAIFKLELIDQFQSDAEVDKELMHAIKGRVRQLAWSTVV